MFHFQPPPPPPPMPMGGFVPPPPPPMESLTNPLEIPTEWFVDVPTASLSEIFQRIPGWQSRFSTHISLFRGGEVGATWARLLIKGKPLRIHYTVAEIVKTSKCVEAGFSPEAPFPVESNPPEDADADVMPVYHAAWTEYCLNRT